MTKKLNLLKEEVKVIKSNADLLVKKKIRSKNRVRFNCCSILQQLYRQYYIFRICCGRYYKKKIFRSGWPLSEKYLILLKTFCQLQSREIKSTQILALLLNIHDTFERLLNSLLVKAPSFSKQNNALYYTISSPSMKLRYSENVIVYQDVSEYFQSVNLDLLVVFKRDLGFFVKSMNLMLFTKKLLLDYPPFGPKK